MPPGGWRQAASEGAVGLFGRKKGAGNFNAVAFANLPGAPKRFPSRDRPTAWGRLPKRLPVVLDLKPGASVVITRNSREDSRIYNGVTGVVAIKDGLVDGDAQKGVYVKLDGASPSSSSTLYRLVQPVEDVKEYSRVDNLGVTRRQSGSRRQLPVQLSAATTIHKAQGRSISRKLFVDMASLWSQNGMVYVAISRTTDPSLMSVAGLASAHAVVDVRVKRFYERISAAALPFWIDR